MLCRVPLAAVAAFMLLTSSPLPADAAFFTFGWEKEGAVVQEQTEISPTRIYPGQSVFFKRRLQVAAASLPVEHVAYRMAVPYLPDFDGIVSWTPLRCDPSTGCTADPALRSQVSFQGPVATRPVSFYTEADYLWDYSRLGVWNPGFGIGDDFELRATRQARPGVYYLRFQLRFDVVNLPKFEGIKVYQPEHVILKRRGAVTPRITITNTGDVPIRSLAVVDEIFDGWAPPRNLQGATVSVLGVDGAEYSLGKQDYTIRIAETGRLEVVVQNFESTAFGRTLDKGWSLWIKYPMNFDRKADQHIYSGRTFVTAVSPQGAFTKSSFTTGLIVKE